MRRYYVAVTESASNDLNSIVDYIQNQDGPAKADYVLDRIHEVMESLAVAPDRGPYPPELAGLGIRDFRQAFFKPYRIVYRVVGHTVYVDLIADGRRNMPALLSRRLLS
jgi:toxin ParE1/3/4